MHFTSVAFLVLSLKKNVQLNRLGNHYCYYWKSILVNYSLNRVMYDFLIVWWYVLYERLFWVFSRLFRSCVDDFAEMCASLLQRQANLKLFPMWFRIRLEFLWCTPSSSHSHTQNIHCKVITNNYWFLQWDSSTAKNYYYYSSVLSFSSHLLADVCELMCKKKYVDLVNDREMVSILICALRNSNEFSFSFFCFSLFDTEKKFLWFGFSHFLIMTTVFFCPHYSA